MTREYQICTRCVMDTTDPSISFDAEGRCNHCTACLVRFEKELADPADRQRRLAALVDKVRASGRGKEYDCLVGVSGGVDSSMVAVHVKELGLRPLAVHFDNGWNSELAVDNIRRLLDGLQIDLVTHVVDWEEFRDLQLSFLKASVPNCEIPTDHGINSLQFDLARRFGITYILSGSNIVTEGILPIAWGHYNQDLRHLRAVHKRHGSFPLRTMPLTSVPGYLYHVFWRGVRVVPLLNLFDYEREAAKRLLAERMGWRDYGGKHYESVWTRFFQGHYLPEKFGFDKRKAHLSTQICAGAITREEALAKLEEPIYPPDLLRRDREFVIKKFGLTQAAFAEIMAAPPRLHVEYPSHHFLFHRMRRYKEVFRRIATRD